MEEGEDNLLASRNISESPKNQGKRKTMLKKNNTPDRLKESFMKK